MLGLQVDPRGNEDLLDADFGRMMLTFGLLAWILLYGLADPPDHVPVPESLSKNEKLETK
jgi:hypothetical protein